MESGLRREPQRHVEGVPAVRRGDGGAKVGIDRQHRIDLGLIINRPQWHSPYGISKAAVHHLTRSLAAEWAPYNIRVNAIAPGYVKTEIADIDLPEYRHYWVDEVPMQRYASPEEIAPTALYLASDASTFTTGSVMVVDGGYTLW